VDLAALMSQAAHECQLAEQAERASLEHYRRTGELLIAAKQAAGHGAWLPLLKKWGFCQQKANNYMRLARGWGKLPSDGDLTLKAALAEVAIAQHNERRQSHEQLRREQASRLTCTLGIVTGDFRMAAADLPDESVDLIFTDPPYDNESVSLYEDLAQLAARVLVEGGSLLCYAGHKAQFSIVPLMNPLLTLNWVNACVHAAGSARLPGAGVFAGWKPILWFVKDRRCTQELIADTVRGGRNKEDHPWQQAVGEAAYYIEHLCPPGGIVLDPFAGSGTTCVAAAQLGRRYVAYEIDPDTAARARARVAEEGQPAEQTA
jgi:16S rRNA G966 N2-methylase RsmD